MSTTQTTVAPAVRAVRGVFRGIPTSDGAGVRLTRIIAQDALPDLDPFLLLDEFGSDDPDAYIAGFPPHPHRGFETVTYMLAGRMRHRDDQGNEGLLTSGAVQWMTAGRGIVHSEMPEQEEGLMRGFQLWVNLPARDKMTAPRYQDIAPEQIPNVAFPGGEAKVIAGSLRGVEGPVRGVSVKPTYLDVALEPGATFRYELPTGDTAFVYAFTPDGRPGEGALRIGDRRLAAGELAVLGEGASVEIAADGVPPRFLLVAGTPLREPIARHGPIVMNTRAELVKAFADLRDGTFSRGE